MSALDYIALGFLFASVVSWFWAAAVQINSRYSDELVHPHAVFAVKVTTVLASIAIVLMLAGYAA